MEYADLLSDYFKRTKRNLTLIDILSTKNCDAHETTQLINSFIGAFVVADYASRIGRNLVKDSELKENVTIQKGDNKDIKRHIRNAVAHGRFQPIAKDSTHEISHLRIEDANKTEDVIWAAEITIDGMRSILENMFVASQKNMSSLEKSACCDPRS